MIYKMDILRGEQKHLWPILRYYPCKHMDEVKKTMKNVMTATIQCSEDSNQTASKCKVGTLIL
jgi:hypothetical protein